jgi:hypothetical protein
VVAAVGEGVSDLSVGDAVTFVGVRAHTTCARRTPLAAHTRFPRLRLTPTHHARNAHAPLLPPSLPRARSRSTCWPRRPCVGACQLPRPARSRAPSAA